MGVKLKVWKQGQFYPELGKMVVELPNHVEIGPSDAQFLIEGFNIIPDSEGNFLEGDYAEDELDAIHTYGIARTVIDMYELILRKSICWPWWKNDSNDPLSIRIHNSGINSRYLRDHHCIELDCYGPYGKRIYNCRTVDLVAHETAHAVVDSLRPHWSSGDMQTRGIVESLCDLTACFWILCHQDLCKDVIFESKGNLRKSNMLSLFGMGHGPSKNSHKEIRNALTSPILAQADSNHYIYGEQLSYLLFQSLIHEFERQCSVVDDPIANLHRSGIRWAQSIIETILLCDSANTSIDEFYDIFLAKFQT